MKVIRILVVFNMVGDGSDFVPTLCSYYFLTSLRCC
jgi:hypothetical protein